VANAVLGVVSAVLAWLSSPIQSRWWVRLALAAAVMNAVVTTIGSALIIFDVTGYYLAGRVSAVGAAGPLNPGGYSSSRNRPARSPQTGGRHRAEH
jgi:hypothetical protein